MRRSRAIFAVLALAGPFAEFGHVIAYRGEALPAAAGHRYFPALLTASGALLAVLLLLGLSLLAAAQLLAGRRVARRESWSFPLLVLGLLSAQLAVFAIQEGLEAHTLPGPDTLAAGLVGQEPVALLGAVLLRWLSGRLGAALEALESADRSLPVEAWVYPAESRLLAAPAFHPGRRPGRSNQERAPPAGPLPA